MTASIENSPETKGRSRRALLAGALGGVAAWAAGAIGRASPVRAEGENIVVGGDYLTAQSVTSLRNQINNEVVLSAASNGSGTGVRGSSLTGDGVYGFSSSGMGVYGTSLSSFGVRGQSGSSVGVVGESNGSVGVAGFSDLSVGVDGYSTASDRPASRGRSDGNSTGVQGFSGPGSIPPAKPKTGVYGHAAQDSTAKGVWGETTTGHAIHATATSGYGLHATATTGWAGYFGGRVFTSKYHELAEISTPSAPSTNRARLFVRDNGVGKTQLCVRFPTGAVQVLATQP